MTFTNKLDKALSEMASLAGWHPTREREYEFYYNGEPLDVDYQYAGTPEQAIQLMVKDLHTPKASWLDPLIWKYAEKAGTSVDQFIAGITAKPRTYTAGQDEQTGFGASDIISINSEKTRQTIEQWLNDNPTPYKWSIHFGNTEPKPQPGTITYVKYANNGDDTLTPHMILHTIGHAICQAAPNAKQSIEAYIAQKMAELTRMPHITRDQATNAFCKLLHMKAAEYTLLSTKRGFPDLSELINELAGIYVKNGKVKIAPNKYCDYATSQEDLTEIKATIEAQVAAALDELVGKVIFDV